MIQSELTGIGKFLRALKVSTVIQISMAVFEVNEAYFSKFISHGKSKIKWKPSEKQIHVDVRGIKFSRQ